MRVDPVE